MSCFLLHAKSSPGPMLLIWQIESWMHKWCTANIFIKDTIQIFVSNCKNMCILLMVWCYHKCWSHLPMLTYQQVDLSEQTSVKIGIKIQHLLWWKCVWKCCLQNFSQFIDGLISLWSVVSFQRELSFTFTKVCRKLAGFSKSYLIFLCFTKLLAFSDPENM